MEIYDETGERLLTMEQAAAAAGVLPESWRRYVARGAAPPAAGYIGRTPLWRERVVRGYCEAKGGDVEHSRV